jgi:hypothetical protein
MNERMTISNIPGIHEQLVATKLPSNEVPPIPHDNGADEFAGQ